MIHSLQLTEFSAFKRVTFEFSPGINVIIGTNSTGKTHLLKSMYATLRAAEPPGGNGVGSPHLRDRLHNKFAAVFRPKGDLVSRLVHRSPGAGLAMVQIGTDSGDLAFTISSHNNVAMVGGGDLERQSCIYLPTREALTMTDWLVPLYKRREIGLDETYFDLCEALLVPTLRGARSGDTRQLIEPLEAIIGGRVVLSEQSFHVASDAGGGNLESTLLAEGFRKIAGLVHLIANGSLGGRSILFWDEPEANLNPELMPAIVAALRALASSGMQIFIATHDYVLSQELSLAVEYSDDDSVAIKFFGLSHGDDDRRIEVEIADTLSQIQRNPILSGFVAHHDREMRLFDAAAGGTNRD